MKIPTFDQVCSWCEEYDNHPTEGWLLSVLDGSITIAEMCRAIVEGRAINMPPDDFDLLFGELVKLPDYKGWEISIDDEDEHGVPVDKWDRRFVWRHPELDERIYCTPNRDRHAVDIEVYPPDGSGYAEGDQVPFTERTAVALFEIAKPWLDEHGFADEDSDGA